MGASVGKDGILKILDSVAWEYVVPQLLTRQIRSLSSSSQPSEKGWDEEAVERKSAHISGGREGYEGK